MLEHRHHTQKRTLIADHSSPAGFKCRNGMKQNRTEQRQTLETKHSWISEQTHAHTHTHTQYFISQVNQPHKHN